MIHVQFSDASKTKIVGMFSCHQPDLAHQGAVTEDDPRYLAFIRPAPSADEVIARITAWRDNEERGDGFVFEHDDHEWDGDTQSYARINAALDGALVLGSLPVGFAWRAADNTDVPVDIAALQAIRDAMAVARSAHGLAIHVRQSAMKAAVASMSTEDLRAFVPSWG